MQKATARFAAFLFVSLSILISGCAGTVKNMAEVPASRVVERPADGKAMVVFMRPSGLGFAIQSSVFEAKDGASILVGIVAAKAKVAYQVDPGKHLFMVVGESADFMNAELLPNKTYYALVTPRMGVWKARFSLRALHQNELNTSEFKGWADGCKWIEKTPESENWAQTNMPSIQSKYTEYFAKWMSKAEAERPMLLPDDGM